MPTVNMDDNEKKRFRTNLNLDDYLETNNSNKDRERVYTNTSQRDVINTDGHSVNTLANQQNTTKRVTVASNLRQPDDTNLFNKDLNPQLSYEMLLQHPP